jgi:hypothetical protein
VVSDRQDADWKESFGHSVDVMVAIRCGLAEVAHRNGSPRRRAQTSVVAVLSFAAAVCGIRIVNATTQRAVNDRAADAVPMAIRGAGATGKSRSDRTVDDDATSRRRSNAPFRTKACDVDGKSI